MRLLVTGATGFLGSTLVPMLVEAGHEVRVLLRKGGAFPGCEVAQGDVLDRDSVKRALQGRVGGDHPARRGSPHPAHPRHK